MAELLADRRKDDELAEVWRRRFHEARDAGLSLSDAELFAENHQDIGLLRQLVADECPAELIAKIIV